MKIAVIGSGGWGTALAIVLHNNGHQVTLWSHTQQESERLDHARENPFLKGVVLPDVIACTSDPACVRGMEMVVMATPSFAVRQTAMRIAPYLEPETVVVSVTKGIEADTGKRMSEIVSEITGKTVAVLSGPSHAEEVARGVPTGCVAACADKRLADLVQDTF
ncbi:MAG: 2-dehydropantoate 2-reductase N-terminal domain-containing protein, partial [Oscillospiraceae bacterium]|nr:2-dehydropantoate 2-reductase N-terminal domain-containing protein [Oscillospiraceae bacterium]